jgi:hypothetical protein
MNNRPALWVLPTVLIFLVVFVAPGQAETASCAALQRQLTQQSERLDRLEDAIRTMQARDTDVQRRSTTAELQRDLNDPLIGTWQCTNQVLTYDMTFFADGLLLQESTTFGPMRELAWTRISSDEIVLPGDVKVRTSLSGNDQMTAENLGNGAKWACRKRAN